MGPKRVVESRALNSRLIDFVTIVAVPANVHDVTVVDEPVDERGRHDVIVEDLALLLEALAARQYATPAFVAARHELKEERRPGATDREVADLIEARFSVRRIRGPCP